MEFPRYYEHIEMVAYGNLFSMQLKGLNNSYLIDILLTQCVTNSDVVIYLAIQC